MRRRARLLPLLAVLACGLAVLGCGTSFQPHQAIPTPLAADAPVLAARLVPPPATLPCYDVVELSLELEANYAQPFFDVTLQAVFTSPEGAQKTVEGFYYGGNQWKVRFRPDTPGTWPYTLVASDVSGARTQATGEVACTPSSAEGPIRRQSGNPYTWAFADGRPYVPIGLQDCFDPHELPDFRMLIDGEGRSDGRARHITFDDYLSIYHDAGFNLFRFSPNNCSYPLFDDLDHFLQPASLATDTLLASAHDHGYRVMYGLFGGYATPVKPAFGFGPLGPGDTLEKERRFIRYSVARWGVYVDFWELLNESSAPDEWVSKMADYVRQIDPERKPVTTSWEKPQLAAIDINAPHWYEREDDLQSDVRVAQLAATWKSAGKPVIVGEQGNTGYNWDPTSAVRMRVRTWTALFEDVAFVFWNTGFAKDNGRGTPGAANLYIGPEERGYIRVLRQFSDRLDANMQPVSVGVSEPAHARAYGLTSDTLAAVYLNHADDHTTPIAGLTLTVAAPATVRPDGVLTATWIDPASGATVASLPIGPGPQTLAVPPFAVDLALLIATPP